jgi:hypothetical protein
LKYGNQIIEESKAGHLRGKIWKIIKKDEIRPCNELSDDEKRNGIKGKQCWVQYVKGDDKGNRWWANNPYYINWSKDNVSWLMQNSGRKEKTMPVIRKPEMYFKSGICWNFTSGNKLEADIKFRIFEGGVYDVNAKRVTGPIWLLGYLNTKLISEIKYNFLNSTVANQIEDIKAIPIKLPTKEEQEYLEVRVKSLIRMMKEGLQEEKVGKQMKTIYEIEEEIKDKVCSIYGVDPGLFK